VGVARPNADLDDRLRALDGCIEKLPARHHELIRRRYAEGSPVNAIAVETGQTPTAVSVLLHRVRIALANCIEKALGPKEVS
jgi:RNA polymerase sigma-70 factor (ECF subfamily)